MKGQDGGRRVTRFSTQFCLPLGLLKFTTRKI